MCLWHWHLQLSRLGDDSRRRFEARLTQLVSLAASHSTPVPPELLPAESPKPGAGAGSGTGSLPAAPGPPEPEGMTTPSHRNAALLRIGTAVLRTLLPSRRDSPSRHLHPLRVAGSLLTAVWLRGDGELDSRDVDIRVPASAGNFTAADALSHAWTCCQSVNAAVDTVTAGAWSWVAVSSESYPCEHVVRDLVQAAQQIASDSDDGASSASGGSGTAPRHGACPWQCMACYARAMYFSSRKDGGCLRVVFCVPVPSLVMAACGTGTAWEPTTSTVQCVSELWLRIRDLLFHSSPEARCMALCLRHHIKMDYSLARQWDEQPLAVHNSVSCAWEWVQRGAPIPGFPLLSIPASGTEVVEGSAPPLPVSPESELESLRTHEWVLVVRSSLLEKPVYRHARDGYFQGGASHVRAVSLAVTPPAVPRITSCASLALSLCGLWGGGGLGVWGSPRCQTCAKGGAATVFTSLMWWCVCMLRMHNFKFTDFAAVFFSRSWVPFNAKSLSQS